jgi:phosphoserine aminotransferase
VPAIAKFNNRKAALVYDTLDSLPVFRPTVNKADRSKTNIVFVIDDPALEKEFLATAKEHGMVGVKGHRSVGGFRVSLYNALPMQSVEILTELMKDFATKKA